MRHATLRVKNSINCYYYYYYDATTALHMNCFPASLLSPASPPRIAATAAATPQKPSCIESPKPSSEAGLLSCICRALPRTSCVVVPPPARTLQPLAFPSLYTNVARTIAYLVLSPRLILQCLPSRQIRVVVWSALHPLGRCSLWHPCITPAPD